MRKTDCHIHPLFTPFDEAACWAEIDKLLPRMDRVGIDTGCIMPLFSSLGSGWAHPGRDETAFAADMLAEIINRYRHRFYGLLWVNPYHAEDFLFPLIEESFRAGAIGGVKLLTEMNVRDEKIGELAGFLEDKDIPVLIHCFKNSFETRLYESTPSDVAYLAECHPRLRIVMAHLKGCGFRGMQEVKGLSNVWVDSSGAWPEDGYLAYTLKTLGPERVLCGSDYPGRDMAVSIGRIDSLEIPQAARENIFFKNTDRLFGRR